MSVTAPRAISAALAALLLAAPAAAATRALIVDGTDPGAVANVSNALTSRGFTVDVQAFVPADLSPYCCVWDLRPFDMISPPETMQYTGFLSQGHGLFLAGENMSCCGPRNSSIELALNGNFLGGPVAIRDERAGTFEELADPFNPVTQSPNVVQRVTYDGQGVAIFNQRGSGEILTEDLSYPSLAAVSWPAGSLAAAPDGRLVVVLDVNWLFTTFAFTDNREFLDNISHFLCPTTASGMAVTIDTAPFALECPATVDLAGQVDASAFDCAQATTPAPPPARSVARDAAALAGLTLDAPGDELLLREAELPVAPGIAAPEATTAPPPAPPTITAVEVAVNGGPFAPVTSTSPALPAPAPVTFLASALPLTLGTNTIVIRATDDLGNSASQSLTGSLSDTQRPVIDLATCQDVRIPLDGTCSASFSDFPLVADLCDPSLTLLSVPPLPIVFSAPGSQAVTHTALDDSLNEASCTRTVTAEDLSAPTVACVAPATVECSATGGSPRTDPAVAAWLAGTTASDNCGVTSFSDDSPGQFASACPPGQATTVTWTALDGSGHSASCSSTLRVQDSTAPTITTTPGPLALECSAAGGVPATAPAVQAWAATFAASDVCAATVALTSNLPPLLPSGCGAGTATVVTFTATDNCSNPATATTTVTVRDTTAPSLSAPVPLTLECNGPGGVPASDPRIQRWLASATAADICDGAAISHNAPALFPSGCGAGSTTSVTFTAVDNCGNATTLTSTVTVRDTTAPALTVPPPLTLECNGPGGVPLSDPQIQAWLAAAIGTDVCDGATLSQNAPALFPSGCGAGTTTSVTFTAVDNCGNATTLSSTVTVRDTTAPVLTVPPPLTLECNSPGGVPLSDPQIQAWLAAASASDLCDGATLSHDAPALFTSGCAPGTTTRVTFRAVDACGNVATLSSTVTVQDTTPPVVSGNALDGICLWPPNHDFYCIDDVSGSITATDLCDPTGVRLEVIACLSSQPEDATGDGHFAPDCVIVNGGKGVCVRSERQGNDPAGRSYRITLGASDGCSNTTPVEIRIAVPHDQSPHADCRRPNAGKSIPARK